MEYKLIIVAKALDGEFILRRQMNIKGLYLEYKLIIVAKALDGQR